MAPRWNGPAAASACTLLIILLLTCSTAAAAAPPRHDTATHSGYHWPNLAAAPPSALQPQGETGPATHQDAGADAWDLAGAVLQPQLACADPTCLVHRVSWSEASVAADPAAPPLLYTVFAEWTSESFSDSDALLPQQQQQRHSLRVCSASSSRSATSLLRCDIASNVLPRGVVISMQLHTDCDLVAVDAARSQQPRGAAWIPLPRCVPAISPTVMAVLPPEPQPLAIVAPGPAPPAHQNNSAAVQAALCAFYAATTVTSAWTRADGWCVTNPGVSYCQWFGVGCDANGAVISLNLGSNMLGSSFAGTSFPGVFSALPSLQLLNLSSNFLLSIRALDLVNNTALSVLDVSYLPPVVQGGVLLPAPLTLPRSPCRLTQLLMDGSFLHFDSARSCTGMEKLAMRSTLQPMNVTDLLAWPALTYFDARGDFRLVGSATTMLSRLDSTNPALTLLDISNTGLSFEADPANPGDSFPWVRSTSLQSLAFGAFKSLTGPSAQRQWLDGVPNLVALDISGLINAAINTSVFATANPAFQSILMTNTPIVPGADLTPLFRLSQLQVLNLDNTNIGSQLPVNVSTVWPLLSVLSIKSSNLVGLLPSFAHLPFLTILDLSSNSLVGDIDGHFAADSPALATLDLSQNSFTGGLPNFENHPQLTSVSLALNLLSSTLPAPFPFLPSLQVFSLQHNKLGGLLSMDLWAKLPAIRTIDLSNNLLSGSIPSPLSPHRMDLFAVANNLFNSAIPTNIMAAVLDLSANTLSGPLILVNASATPPGATYPVRTLNLQGTIGLSCPIDLSMLTSLTSLSIQNGGFTGCDFANSSLVKLPSSLSLLDISDCDWAPLYLLIPPNLHTLRVNRANVFGFAAVGSNHAIVELSLSGNLLTEQLGSFSSLFSAAPLIRSLSCSECGLSFRFEAFMALFTHQFVLEQLDLSLNSLTGALPATLFSIVGTSALPTSIRLVDLSFNWALTGYLPVGDASFSSLHTIDMGQTSVIGVLDKSWQAFSGLQHVAIDQTLLQAPLSVNAAGKLIAAMPTWLTISTTTFTGFTSAVDNTASFHCPAVFIAGKNSSIVEMDPFYHASTLCTCDATCFGRTGICYSCPEGCTCNRNVIMNCYPVLQRGEIPTTTTGAVLASQIKPFSVTTFLPCPRTLVGQELCNPNGVEWPSFYDVRVLASDGSTASISENVDLSSWCYPGHTGRLCAQCSSGYFSSGRWCLECLSQGVHVLIFLASLLLGVAVVTYLYLKSPGTAQSQSALRHYSSKLGRSTRQESLTRQESFTRQESISRPTPTPMHLMPVNGAAGADSDLSISMSSPSFAPFEMVVEAEVATEAVNPLKLLIFHSQQLSLLLQTTASMPSVIAGLMSAVSSGSNGFSLSSLVAMECLYSSWSIKHRCWLALVAPMLIGLVSGVTYAIDHRHAAAISSHGTRRLSEREERLLGDSEVASELPHRASSTFPRIYGVCVSLFYLLVFPCAQTVLSALTCTDNRDADVASSPVYLNLFPAQQCDAEWRATILPPALLGVIFWMVAFPLASTALLWRLKRRMHSHPTPEDSAAALSAWPICSDLLSSYAPRYWYYEQILLMRRLLLVAAVCIIPSSSLYLPLALFALIQLCALLQHWTHPYSHPLLNAGELLSLYLLLINYISALILQTGLVEGGFQQTANGWAAALFVSNLVFLLLLVAALFGWFRLWAASKWAQFVKRRGRGAPHARSKGHERPRHSRSPSI